MHAMDRSAQNSGTSEVREAHRFDAAALDAWMAREVEGYPGRSTVEQFKGGQSNPTYKLVTPGRAYVLRRKPPGQAAARRACRRPRISGDHRARRARASRSPRTYGLCLDEAVIGTPFYVMEMVEGRIFWEADFPEVARGRAAGLFRRDERDHRRAPRDRSRGGGPRRLWQARQLFRAPDRPLVEAISRATSRPAGSRRWTGWSNGCRANIPRRRAAAARSSTATSAATTWSSTRPSRRCWRCSTGSCRRSATRSPTSPII